MVIYLLVILGIRNVSDKYYIGNQHKCFVLSNIFFENLAAYETMLKNIVEPGRSQITK